MVENAPTIMMIASLMLVSFGLGGILTITAAWIGALFTRKAYTNEPLFKKVQVFEDEPEDIEIPLTQEEKEEIEHAEMQHFRGQL